jgi:outer membrane murein-binding lipoprotein Lpp
MVKYKRRIKLIKPRLQISLTMIFMGLSALGILMQFILFQSTLTKLATGLPNDGSRLMEQMNGSLLVVLGVTLLAILPLTYLVGVLTTFRIAGPVHRMQTFLGEVEQKGYTHPCKLRKGDQLQDLVAQLNATLEALGQEGDASPEDGQRATASATSADREAA